MSTCNNCHKSSNIVQNVNFEHNYCGNGPSTVNLVHAPYSYSAQSYPHFCSECLDVNQDAPRTGLHVEHSSNNTQCDSSSQVYKFVIPLEVEDFETNLRPFVDGIINNLDKKNFNIFISDMQNLEIVLSEVTIKNEELQNVIDSLAVCFEYFSPFKDQFFGKFYSCSLSTKRSSLNENYMEFLSLLVEPGKQMESFLRIIGDTFKIADQFYSTDSSPEFCSTGILRSKVMSFSDTNSNVLSSQQISDIVQALELYFNTNGGSLPSCKCRFKNIILCDSNRFPVYSYETFKKDYIQMLNGKIEKFDKWKRIEAVSCMKLILPIESLKFKEALVASVNKLKSRFEQRFENFFPKLENLSITIATIISPNEDSIRNSKKILYRLFENRPTRSMNYNVTAKGFYTDTNNLARVRKLFVEFQNGNLQSFVKDIRNHFAKAGMLHKLQGGRAESDFRLTLTIMDAAKYNTETDSNRINFFSVSKEIKDLAIEEFGQVSIKKLELHSNRNVNVFSFEKYLDLTDLQ